MTTPRCFDLLRRLTLKTFCLSLAFALFAVPISAQRRPAPKKPAAEQPPQQTVSFDTLLAADSYKVYGEVRAVGQLIRSDGLKDALDPVLKLAGPPKEFKALVKWLNARSDPLLTSRLMFGLWPSRPKLPQTLVAIEFASAEDAQKFEPQLRDFLPKLLPAPSPASSPGPRSEPGEAKQNEKPTGPQYVLKQVGQIVFITDVPFALKDLKPRGSKLLADDPTFHVAHERFMADSIFLYVDFASIERDEEKERKQRAEEEQKRMEAAALAQQKAAELNTPPDRPEEETPKPEESKAASDSFTITEVIKGNEKPPEPDPVGEALALMPSLFFGGQGKWPDGIGASLVFDGDSYVVRVLLVNSPNEKTTAIPFLPQLISGPLIAPEASSVLPADAELFVSASLDLPQIHEGMIRAAKFQFEQIQKANAINGGAPIPEQPVSPFEAIEKKLGIKLKDDVLPLLGNEIALTIPMSVIDAGPEATVTVNASRPGEEEKKGDQPKVDEGPNPVIAISVRDREGLRNLLPKIIDSVGFKGASMIAQTEKREDTELVTFANAFGYALIGNFLIVSNDTRAVRHVVDSYLKHETLSSNTNFRNATRWQPRQVLGQIYLSPALMESYNSFARNATSQISDQLRDFLMMLSPVAQPVTYALSNEGQGPIHELHVPKNLLMLMLAGMSADSNQPPATRNEAVMRSTMRTLFSAEQAYQATEGAGRYGTLDDLLKAQLISKDLTRDFGYKVEITASETKFEVSAVPIEYGKTGMFSFFIDESGVLRGADRGGGPASVADRPVQ